MWWPFRFIGMAFLRLRLNAKRPGATAYRVQLAVCGLQPFFRITPNKKAPRVNEGPFSKKSDGWSLSCRILDSRKSCYLLLGGLFTDNWNRQCAQGRVKTYMRLPGQITTLIVLIETGSVFHGYGY